MGPGFGATPTKTTAGGSIKIEATNDICGSTYLVELLPGQIKLGSFTPDYYGSSKVSLTVPKGVAPGIYEVAKVAVGPSGKKFYQNKVPLIVSSGSGSMAQVVLSLSLVGDRLGDVLAADRSGKLWRFPGTAAGQLGRGIPIGSGFSGFELYPPGDWTGDGRADLIAVKDGRMYLYPGNGTGGLGKAQQIGHGWTPFRVIPAGDLTGDGIPDMLAIYQWTGTLYLYSGNGKGGFKPGNTQVGHGWETIQLFAAGDLNQDGKTDILGVTQDGRLLFYAGKGNGFFHKAQQVGHGWRGLELIAGADLNGDGLADIVARTPQGLLNLYPGKGGGTFGKPIQIGRGF